MTVSELLPCRFCGSECRVETFDSDTVQAGLWICSNCQFFVGDCPDTYSYLSAEAWQDAMKAAEPLPQGDEVERVAAALIASEESLLSGDTSPDNMIAARMLARAAITAIGSQSIEGPLSVRCPNCGAPVGSECRTIQGVIPPCDARSLAKDEERHG